MWRRYYQRWHKLTGAEVEPELLALIPVLTRFVPPATIIDKYHYSPFAEGTLPAFLHEHNVDTLIITGAETDVCVLAAVLGAIDRGFRTVIVTDAICSSADEHHDALMKLYHQRFTDQVETATAHEVLSQWQRG
jgi:nicotinamidase-related amidase